MSVYVLIPEIDFAEATYDLIAKAEGSDVIRGLSEEAGLTPYQALSWVTRMQATGYLPRGMSIGQEAEALSVWHRQVRGECTEEYQRVQRLQPDSKREDIRQNVELRKLNAVRLGLRGAMARSARLAQMTGEIDRSEEWGLSCAKMLRHLAV